MALGHVENLVAFFGAAGVISAKKKAVPDFLREACHMRIVMFEGWGAANGPYELHEPCIQDPWILQSVAASSQALPWALQPSLAPPSPFPASSSMPQRLGTSAPGPPPSSPWASP